MRTINRVTLIGRVHTTPLTPNGSAHFILVTDDAKGIASEFHRISLSGQLASFTMNTVKKHDQIYVEGRLSYDQYYHATIYATELVVFNPRRVS